MARYRRSARSSTRRSSATWAIRCHQLPAGSLVSERAGAMLGAEVVCVAVGDPDHGALAVDLHPARGVGCAAALGEPEQSGEHDHAEDVQDELVVDLDRA